MLPGWLYKHIINYVLCEPSTANSNSGAPGASNIFKPRNAVSRLQELDLAPRNGHNGRNACAGDGTAEVQAAREMATSAELHAVCTTCGLQASFVWTLGRGGNLMLMKSRLHEAGPCLSCPMQIETVGNARGQIVLVGANLAKLEQLKDQIMADPSCC